MSDIAKPLPKGARGFDVNMRVTPGMAADMVRAGYAFAIRYVCRETPAVFDLNARERLDILTAGLGLMVVQHVKSETSWYPNRADGQRYGVTAAAQCTAIGIATGTTVWLDLEGVSPNAMAADVIAYCGAWHAAVESAGYQPGLYVGWHSHLDPRDLYALPFTAYWAAYNLDADQEPANVGVMMRQHLARQEDVGYEFGVDLDAVTGDALGRFPMADLGQPQVVANV